MSMLGSGGKAIALAREKRGWTQQRLAQEVGVDKSRVNRLEKGVGKLDLATLESFLRALEMGWEQYFRLLVLCEQAERELGSYAAAEQASLPLELGEPAAPRPPALGGWNDPETEAAHDKLNAAILEFLLDVDKLDVRRAFREQRAKARREPPIRRG